MKCVRISYVKTYNWVIRQRSDAFVKFKEIFLISIDIRCTVYSYLIAECL